MTLNGMNLTMKNQVFDKFVIFIGPIPEEKKDPTKNDMSIDTGELQYF